jgi:hypothetical protein
MDDGVVTNFWLFLDNIDATPAVNVAYHGSIAAKK